MPECEICGKTVDNVYEIMLDGSQMLVCEKDARGKKVVSAFGPEQKNDRRTQAGEAREEPEELVENYGKVIRKARESMGLPLKVLGERISEKESTLERIEKEKTLPTEKTRIKLERELGIRLLAKPQVSKTPLATQKSEPPTLWDLAKKDDKSGE
jgi:putative transcription factor